LKLDERLYQSPYIKIGEEQVKELVENVSGKFLPLDIRLRSLPAH